MHVVKNPGAGCLSTENGCKCTARIAATGVNYYNFEGVLYFTVNTSMQMQNGLLVGQTQNFDGLQPLNKLCMVQPQYRQVVVDPVDHIDQTWGLLL